MNPEKWFTNRMIFSIERHYQITMNNPDSKNTNFAFEKDIYNNQ